MLEARSSELYTLGSPGALFVRNPSFTTNLHPPLQWVCLAGLKLWRLFWHLPSSMVFSVSLPLLLPCLPDSFSLQWEGFYKPRWLFGRSRLLALGSIWTIFLYHSLPHHFRQWLHSIISPLLPDPHQEQQMWWSLPTHLFIEIVLFHWFSHTC